MLEQGARNGNKTSNQRESECVGDFLSNSFYIPFGSKYLNINPIPMEFILKYNPCDSVPEYLRSGAFPRFHKARTLLQFINLVGVPQRYVHRHNPPSKKLIPTLQLDVQRISISSTFQCLKKFESSSLFLVFAFTLPYLTN